MKMVALCSLMAARLTLLQLLLVGSRNSLSLSQQITSTSRSTYWKPRNQEGDSYSTSDLKSGFRMRSQKPSFVAVDLHAHVPQEATDSHSSNSSSSSSSSKPRTKASVSFADQIEPYSSISSLSVQSSGSMDLVSATCNISSLRDVELTEDDRMELSALLSGLADHEVLIDKFQIDMTRKKQDIMFKTANMVER